MVAPRPRLDPLDPKPPPVRPQDPLPGRERAGTDPAPALGPERGLGRRLDLFVLASRIVGPR
ncbi:MAG TPA: hypothetical protein VFS43_05830 [Polyangiaceae bacterium]|nr:hypothetical protein [Polyangiaceae bacterium]